MLPCDPPSLRPSYLARSALWALLLAMAAGASAATPVPGFREDFAGMATNGWGGGAVTSNPGTGGLGGAGDGYLLVAVPGPLPGNLGTTTPNLPYTGDWTAAGVTQVRLWLNDVNAQDTLEIHFALGNSLSGNFWQYTPGFIPPPQQWAPFTVDLSAPASFSFIGAGTPDFGAALANVDRVLVRHDKAPYAQTPDVTIGDFGLDGILLTDGVAGVAPGLPLAVGSPVRLAPPAPNPSRGAVSLRMDAADAGTVVLQVVDALGRVVRHASLPAGAAGSRTWTWDGVDDRGMPAAAGYYRVRAIGRAGGTSQPLVRLP